MGSDTFAKAGGSPATIYSQVSDLHTCMAGQIHYQRFEIPLILHKPLTSFHLPNPPIMEGRAAQRAPRFCPAPLLLFGSISKCGLGNIRGVTDHKTDRVTVQISKK